MSKINLDFFQKDLDTRVKEICNKINPNDELEVSFGSQKKPISLKKFNNLLKYINFRSIRDKIQKNHSTQIDITYSYDQKSMSNYRISINGIEQINNFIQNNNLLKNHTIFSKQIRTYISQDKIDTDTETNNKITLINKVKESKKFIALDEYDMRIKLSNEKTDISQSTLKNLLSLDETERHQISFRYKQRVSLELENNSDYNLNIDLT